MPTYHAAKWVATTIDSVIAQTYPHLELIVVDDGSQDDTVSVVRRKLAADFRNDWKIIELGANRGPSAARNAGLTAANRSWVQFLDSDDLIPPTKFERQMAYCARAPGRGYGNLFAMAALLSGRRQHHLGRTAHLAKYGRPSADHVSSRQLAPTAFGGSRSAFDARTSRRLR
jgi:glycosyltransferase involved in cell wall biosynthesis